MRCSGEIWIGEGDGAGGMERQPRDLVSVVSGRRTPPLVHMRVGSGSVACPKVLVRVGGAAACLACSRRRVWWRERQTGKDERRSVRWLVVVLTEDEAGRETSLGDDLGLRRATGGILHPSAFYGHFLGDV